LTERFSLGGYLDQPVQRLSLGQRMRCEITASLLHGPKVLFLDEPMIGLDITAKAAIRDFIREQSEIAGQSVLLTSHDTRDIELVCERVIVINEGRIVVDQPVAELRRRYLGRKVVTIQSQAPEMAVDLPGVVRRHSEAHTTVTQMCFHRPNDSIQCVARTSRPRAPSANRRGPSRALTAAFCKRDAPTRAPCGTGCHEPC
jgi:ABC-2 type transport system ATP-binding protein